MSKGPSANRDLYIEHLKVKILQEAEEFRQKLNLYPRSESHKNEH